MQRGGHLERELQGGGHLERELQHLVSQKAPIYRGVATSVSDLQRCQRGLLTRACTSDLCLEQRSVGEGRRATAACIGWSAPWCGVHTGVGKAAPARPVHSSVRKAAYQMSAAAIATD